MASETFGADEARERQRWGDNKVYTRKYHNKGNKVNNNTTNNNSSANPTVTNVTNNDEEVNNRSNNLQQSLQTVVTTAEDGTPPRRQQLQNLSRFEAASGDSSSHNQGQPQMANGNGMTNGKGSISGVVRVENKVRISLSLVRSKDEVQELREKLASELEHVRNMVKKLEAKETQISGHSGLRLPASDVLERDGAAVRVDSEVGSVGHQISRPFHGGGLSVLVNENNHVVGGEVTEKEKRTPKANQYYNSDFVLGKEKFPPLESNKKMRPNGFGLDKHMSQAFRNCGNVLNKLMKHKHGWVFNTPVDVEGLGLHDYYDIIRHPMDLGTVKNRLNKNWYKSPREFAEDVRLTFRNAMTYNPKGQDVHIMAEQLSNIFEEKWPAIEAQYNFDLRYYLSHESGLPTPTSGKLTTPRPRPLPPPSQMRSFDQSEFMKAAAPSPALADSRLKPSNSTHIGRTPLPKKPKAKDPDKRDMTQEEKQKLSTNLQSLPPEKLDGIVHIIKKRNSALSQHDDEIEVDIDSVDAETLWELDRFVTNYKKSLSKNKRKAEIALQATAGAAHTIQGTNEASTAAEAAKETRTDGKYASNSPAQGDNQRENASRSSSSSSSSSDSGSSSSDSDSDSSSGSDSDADHSPRT